MATSNTQARRRKPTKADFVRCRSVLKHKWDTTNRTDVDADITLLCERCTMERLDWLDSIGNIFRRKYIVPEGYKLPRGEARPTMADARLQLISELTAAAGKPKPRTRKAPAKRR